jgi:prepilin-type N-terminal cleavage/methylation domain-containing protein
MRIDDDKDIGKNLSSGKGKFFSEGDIMPRVLRMIRKKSSGGRPLWLNLIDNKGFTLIELTVVVAIMGILMISSYPNILNALETRTLENSAKDILMVCHQARYLSVSTKLNHRVKFSNTTGRWLYWIEKETDAGTWSRMDQFLDHEVPKKLPATVNLPGELTVEYSSIGYVANFDSLHNRVTLQSDKLRAFGQPDLRILVIYAGGSIQFTKSQST